MGTRVLSAAFFAVLVVPIVGVILLSASPTSAMDFYVRWPPSFQWWRAFGSDGRWIHGLAVSLVVGTLSATVGLMIALPAIVYWRITGSRAAERALLGARLPFAVPPVVLAVGMYQMVSRGGLFDRIGGLVFAHVGLTVAVTVFVLTARFRSSSLTLYVVARGLGASAFRAAITWMAGEHRLTLAACFASCVLVSMSEVTVTLFVTDTKVLTLSKVAVSGMARDINPTGFAAMATWMVCIGLILVTSALWKRNGPDRYEE